MRLTRAEALAFYEEYVTTHPRGLIDHARRFMGLASKDEELVQLRVVQLKAYLESSSSDLIDLDSFIRFITKNHPGSWHKLYGDLMNPDLPCAKIFAALAGTAPVSDETKARLTELSPLVTKKATIAIDLSRFAPEPVSFTASTEKPLSALPKTEQLLLGDLHANAIKFIHLLIKNKVITGLTESHYSRLIEIYKKPSEELTEKDIEEFGTLLANAKIHPDSPALVKLIGDTICDRGENDIFMFLIFERLACLDITLKIEASNHDVAFIKAYSCDKEGKLVFGATHLRKEGDQRSTTNLQNLLEKFPKLNDRVASIIEKHYLPSLELLSYAISLDGKTINICTHAPFGLTDLKDLAGYFNLAYKDSSLVELAKTIDSINVAVVKRGGISAIYEFLKDTSTHKVSNPLYKIIWGREHELKRPYVHGTEAEPYYICWFHGHDRNDSFADNPHIINLDDSVGKGPFSEESAHGICQVAFIPFCDAAKKLPLSASFEDPTTFLLVSPSRVEPAEGDEPGLHPSPSSRLWRKPHFKIASLVGLAAGEGPKASPSTINPFRI